MRKLSIFAAATATALSFATPASAVTILVDAKGNSSSGGTAVATGLTVAAGDAISVLQRLGDLWSAGALPRYSDGNGLTGDRFSTPGDDSGQPLFTQIGQDFGLYSQGNLSAAYGSLVGVIGGQYFLLGSNNAPVISPYSGALSLVYWDSNEFDNFGDITFDITAAATAVPEPATWAMMVAAFGLVGFAMRRRVARVTASFI